MIVNIFTEDIRIEGKPTFPYSLSLELEKKTEVINLLTKINRNKKKNNVLINYYKVPLWILKNKPSNIRLVSKLLSPITLLVFLSSKVVRAKLISQPDFAENIFSSRRSLIKKIIDLPKYLIFRINLRLIKKFIFATKYEEELMTKIDSTVSKKSTIIPLGTEFKIGSQKKENYILSVSNWKEKKNLTKIIAVFQEVSKIDKNIKLKIAGTFETKQYEKKCKFLVKNLKLNKKVEFLGIKKGKELENLFRKAKLFYLPSQFESFGLVFIEALSSGTPIIAEENSAIKFIVKNKKTGILADSEEKQKEAISFLLRNKTVYKEFQKNCLIDSKQYQIKEVAKKWEKVFK